MKKEEVQSRMMREEEERVRGTKNRKRERCTKHNHGGGTKEQIDGDTKYREGGDTKYKERGGTKYNILFHFV